MSSRIDHEGEVIAVSLKQARVKIIQNSACSSCHAHFSCSISETKEKIIDIPTDDKEIHVGDKVVVVGTSSMGLRAVLYAFAIPLFITFVSVFLSTYWINNEGMLALITIGVVALYYIVLYFFRDRLKGKFIFQIEKV
jgi:Positive regulator of sigma E activity